MADNEGEGLAALEKVTKTVEEEAKTLEQEVENLRDTHKRVVKEETDLLTKWDIAVRFIDQIEVLEAKLENRDDKSVKLELLNSVAALHGLFLSIKRETEDIREKIREEFGYESEVIDIEEKLLNQINRMEAVRDEHAGKGTDIGKAVDLKDPEDIADDLSGRSAEEIAQSLGIE